jgi:predicted Zn-dependent peptidase
MNIEQLRTKAPDTQQVEKIDLPQPEHFLLENGIPVYCINAGDQEVLKIDLNFPIGSAIGEQPLAAHFTNQCLREGTENFSSAQIAEMLDYYGASLNTSVSRDDSRVMLFCLNKYLDQLMPILSEIVLRPSFPDAEIKTVAHRAKQEYLVEMEKVKVVARREFGKVVFGEMHPYGKYAGAEDYDNIDGETLADFNQRYYLKTKFRIIVSGRIPANIRELLNENFGQHQVIEFQPTALPPSATVLNNKLIIEKPGSLQSGLAMGKAMFNLHHPDYIKLQVVNTIFGGYFGSRLMTNIREDKGFTYGIHSHLFSMQQAGMLYIATQVGTEVTQQALDEVFGEMERLRTEPVPQHELDLVKNYLLGVLLQQADGPFAQAELLKSVLDYRLDLSYYQKYIHTIKSITTDEILDLAVKYLDPGSMVSVVVGEKVN